MSTTYKVVVVGMGKRGMHHAAAFQANPRFEVAGICDIDPARPDAAAAKLGDAVTRNGRAAGCWPPRVPTSSASAPCPPSARS